MKKAKVSGSSSCRCRQTGRHARGNKDLDVSGTFVAQSDLYVGHFEARIEVSHQWV